jgi:hypothetical protein
VEGKCFPKSSKGAMILFRKIYKEANDSIHGDRAVLDRAFEMAEKPEKKEKKILKYSFVGTAAAAVLIVCALFVNYKLLPLSAVDMEEAEDTTYESADLGLESRKQSSSATADYANLVAEDKNTVSYTAEEYFDYIGIDLSKIELPKDMSLDIEKSYSLTEDDNGNLSGDVVIFTSSGGEISVMTSRIEDVQWAIDMYEKAGENMAVMDDGQFVTLYMIKDGTSVTIEGENISADEIKDIAKQIEEQK